MPRVLCPACSQMLDVPDAALGKSASCPACKHRFTVPGSPALPPKMATAVVEEPVSGPPAGAKPPVPPESRKKKRRKKHKRSAGWLGRRWLMVAAAVGGVGLLVSAWLLLGGGGDGGDAALAREPKGGTVYPHEFPPADPAGWKVAVEAADPPPAGLRSVVATPDFSLRGKVVALTFADPKAATAAVIFEPRYDSEGRRTRTQPWVQVSLTDPAGAKVVPLTDSVAQKFWEVALSPSGDRLATAFPSGVVILDRDGRKLGEWPEGKITNLTDADRLEGKLLIRGLWFASADRLLVLTPDTLRCREVGTGKLVYERPLKLAGDAVLTPRRTWLLAGVEDGVEAIATADGSTAGRLTVPGFKPAGGIRLAVSPDGSRLAGLPSCDSGQPLVVWTLADGKPAFARYYDLERKWLAGTARVALPFPLHWAGDRHLMIGGRYIFDLDLGGITFAFRVNDMVIATPTGAIPDGRAWRLISPWVAMREQFAAAAPGGDNYLTATTVPALPDGGVVLGPHTSFRVSAAGVSGSTAVVRESLADALADRGYRVDPAADLIVHFEGVRVNRTRVGGREVSNPKWNQRPPNGWVLVEMVDAYEVSYRVKIRDRQGRVLWESNNCGCNAIDFEGKGSVVGWSRAAKEAAGMVPAGLVRLIPDSPPVNLPQKIAARADGTAEVVPDP